MPGPQDADWELAWRSADRSELDAAATLFVGTVQGLVMQSMTAGRPIPVRTGADAVFTILLRGLRRA